MSKMSAAQRDTIRAIVAGESMDGRGASLKVLRDRGLVVYVGAPGAGKWEMDWDRVFESGGAVPRVRANAAPTDGSEVRHG